MIIAPLLAGLMAATASATPAGVVDFTVNTTPLRLSLPAGYCTPTGQLESVAAMMAAADNLNVTLATLATCGAPQAAFNDYFLVKAVKDSLPMELSRPVLMAGLGPAFKAVDGKAVLDHTRSAMKESFGDALTVTDGAIGPVGQDGVCGYLAGVMGVKSGETEAKVTLTSCVTSVKRKVIAIHHYRVGLPQGTQAERLAVVRRVADRMIAENEK
jgi:hypothetical protein